jgi:Flp pilus assembly pilin Flp
MLTSLYLRGRRQVCRVLNKARELRNDRRGVTALEYSMIAGVTVVAIGAALVNGSILSSINTIWTTIQTDLSTVAAG